MRDRLFLCQEVARTEYHRDPGAFVSESAFGTTLLDGSEGMPVPEELLADTVKV